MLRFNSFRSCPVSELSAGVGAGKLGNASAMAVGGEVVFWSGGIGEAGGEGAGSGVTGASFPPQAVMTKSETKRTPASIRQFSRDFIISCSLFDNCKLRFP